MPKIPYKAEKTKEDDEDYEIVSFEDFCDKSPGCKTDLLTLNDNINYRLCYESDKGAKFAGDQGESSRDSERLKETSLNGPKNVTFKRKLSNSFAPFGRSNGKPLRGPLFSGVIPKPRNEGESTSREHRYQRFSERSNICHRAWDHMSGMGAGALGLTLLCALCVGGWWLATDAVGGAWEEQHYKKLWERAHPDNIKKPPAPLTYEKPVLPEIRYHDHNNLSTKNKLNATEQVRKKTELSKKKYPEESAEFLNEVCAKLTDNMRFDCHPQDNANENDCVSRGCCWRTPTTNTSNIPYCFYPPQYSTFKFLNMTEDKHSVYVYYEKARPSGYPDDFEVVLLHIKSVSDDTVRINYYDALRRRFEPPFPEISLSSKKLSSDIKYRVKIPEDGSGIGFKVIRNSDNVTVFDTVNVGGLILSNKFLQLSAVISSDHIFGLGERRARFMVDMNWKTFGLFNRDRKPVENANLYGTHPFYMSVEPDGKTHGVLFINSNAMDIVVQPTPAITYRTIGGILDFYIFMGPTPAKVMQQFTEIVGRSFLPPYWALGFHLCRFNYKSLNETREVWKKNRDAGLPFDAQWNDIDYMKDRNDFTYDQEKFAGLPEFVDELHKSGMHYVVITDPGISASEKPGTYPPYDRGLEMGVFIKNSTGQPLIGKVWNRASTVYPDFTHTNITTYWVEMLTNFHKKVAFDGLWIDMNEPSNFVDGTLVGSCAPENLPYMPHLVEPQLRTHTICMDAEQFVGQHYDLHNLYGIGEAMVTQFALTEIRAKRPFVITRSSFTGLGSYAGHWSGDVDSTWHDLRMTIPELLNFAIFGIPMMGADICGFAGDTTPELCKRWMQLGAFYPFSRNHNDDTSKPQDPASMGPEVLEASIKSLRLRYRLLPYYYTLFWGAHYSGDTVIRPLFFEWPDNVALHAIDDQFLIGPSVMVTPLLKPGSNITIAVFPGDESWYNIVNGLFLARNETRPVLDFETVSVRGGSVLVLQEPPPGAVSTASARSAPLQLFVVPDKNHQAKGHLFWDDGESLNTFFEKKYSNIEFKMNRTELYNVPLWWGHGAPPINKITIVNLPHVYHVTVNSNQCSKPKCSFEYFENRKVLNIHVQKLSLNRQFFVEWYYEQDVEPKDLYNYRAEYVPKD